ncbi:MAG: hypothetical protein K8R73_02260, partial [Clostridiales bacterium]|nr:hypothetical protein [Clostridiales bacterium]
MKKHIVLLSLAMISMSFGYNADLSITLQDIEKMASAKDTELIYSELIAKGFQLVEYDEDEFGYQEWTYAFDYNSSKKVAQIWVYYRIKDIEFAAEKYQWDKDWFLRKGVILPDQQYDPVNTLTVLFAERSNYEDITTQIKSEHEKRDAAFDKNLNTYTYTYINANFRYTCYQTSGYYELKCEFFDPEKSSIINGYYTSNDESKNKYQNDIRKKWENGNHTICECKENYANVWTEDSLFWFCRSYLDEYLEDDW